MMAMDGDKDSRMRLRHTTPSYLEAHLKFLEVPSTSMYTANKNLSDRSIIEMPPWLSN